MMPDIHTLQIFFLEAEFELLVAQFLSQRLFFFVEVQEDLDVPIKLSLLLILNDLLDFSRSLNFKLEILKISFVFLCNLSFDLLLEASELLSPFVDMLLHSLFHFSEVLLVNLPGLEQGQPQL